MTRGKHWGELVALTIAILLIVVVGTLREQAENQAYSVPSTYDTGANGYAALYELLAREGVSVTRYEQPLSQMYARHGTVVIAGDSALESLAFTPGAVKALDEWVRSGRTLVLVGESPGAMRTGLGVPATAMLSAADAGAACGLDARVRRLHVTADFESGFALQPCGGSRLALLTASRHTVGIAYRRGSGEVIVITASDLFDNLHLAQQNNAAFALAVFSGASSVAFDEAMYGHEIGSSFWAVLPLPMRVAIIAACIAIVLAILGANLPFAPPFGRAVAGGRDSSEYIASLARMLQRGGARIETIDRLCKPAREQLAMRANDPQNAELADRARALNALYSPTAEDVIAAGTLFWQVRKEFR